MRANFYPSASDGRPYLGLKHRPPEGLGVTALAWQTAKDADARWEMYDPIIAGTMEQTKARDIPAWDELYSQGLSGEDAAFRGHIDNMSGDERVVFSIWQYATEDRLVKTTNRLMAHWAPEGVQDGSPNQAFWEQYGNLSKLEQTHFQSTLAARFARSVLSGQDPTTWLYDAWRNTGRQDSLVWRWFERYLISSASRPGQQRTAIPDTLKISGAITAVTSQQDARVATPQIRVGQSLAMVEYFMKVLDLRSRDSARHVQIIDKMPWDLTKAYYLWERRRDLERVSQPFGRL